MGRSFRGGRAKSAGRADAERTFSHGFDLIARGRFLVRCFAGWRLAARQR